jgi:hypothetical protein
LGFKLCQVFGFFDVDFAVLIDLENPLGYSHDFIEVFGKFFVFDDKLGLLG